MNIHRTIAIMMIAAICMLFVSHPSDPNVKAQDDPEFDCLTTVQTALQVVGSACAEMGRNEACYGHAGIDAMFRDGADVQFDISGDLSELADLLELVTHPIDLDVGTWGISLIEVQADLPDESEDNVTFVLLGDASLRPSSGEEMAQGFLLNTGNDETCTQASDGLLVRSPEGQRARINVNGVEIEMSSGAFITAQPDGNMTIQGIEGGIDITAGGHTETITTAMTATVPMNENLAPSGPPSPPTLAISDDIFPFDLYSDIFTDLSPSLSSLPSFSTFPPPVYVTSANSWTESGIAVTAGQQVVVFAWGSMNTCFGSDEIFCYFNGPSGKSETSCTLEPCLLNGAPFGLLVGRVGSETVFEVGTGGVITVPESGELVFGINDAGWEDNAGGYIVRVIPLP
jgi:hypothetical protein